VLFGINMLKFMPCLLALVHHAVAEVGEGILALVCVPVHAVEGHRRRCITLLLVLPLLLLQLLALLHLMLHLLLLCLAWGLELGWVGGVRRGWVEGLIRVRLLLLAGRETAGGTHLRRTHLRGQLLRQLARHGLRR
jgi:hypothetical protein